MTMQMELMPPPARPIHADGADSIHGTHTYIIVVIINRVSSVFFLEKTESSLMGSGSLCSRLLHWALLDLLVLRYSELFQILEHFNVQHAVQGCL